MKKRGGVGGERGRDYKAVYNFLDLCYLASNLGFFVCL